MNKHYIIIGIATSCFILIGVFLYWYNQPIRRTQRHLNKYMKKSFSASEVGRHYERFVGQIFEKNGYDVKYHGALNGYSDLGRDLIVSSQAETLVIQTKCWSKKKSIQEKHIFQLFGSMTHYQKTENFNNNKVRAVFYSTTQFSETSKKVASTLGVELNILKF